MFKPDFSIVGYIAYCTMALVFQETGLWQIFITVLMKTSSLSLFKCVVSNIHLSAAFVFCVSFIFVGTLEVGG